MTQKTDSFLIIVKQNIWTLRIDVEINENFANTSVIVIFPIDLARYEKKIDRYERI